MANSTAPAANSGLYADPREDWLALRTEEVIDPERPIVDPHHHLWDRGGRRYMIEELVDDIASGHNIIATVYVEAPLDVSRRGTGSVSPRRRSRIRQRRRGDERERRLRSCGDLRRHRRPRQSAAGRGARARARSGNRRRRRPLSRHPAFLAVGCRSRRRRHVRHAPERPAARRRPSARVLPAWRRWV